jgi:hypothetical protein
LTKGDDRGYRRETPAAGRPQPTVIAEPDELGDALAWMLATAEGSAPRTVADLAKRLGISQAQVYKYLSGETVPPENKWEAILDVFGFAGPARGAWASAGQRVRDRLRLRRTRERQGQRTGLVAGSSADEAALPIGVEPGEVERGPAAPRRRRWPTVVALALAAVLGGVAATLIGLTGGSSVAGSTSAVSDVQCLGLGSATTWQNHHSSRYLSITADVQEPGLVDPARAASRPPSIVTGPREGLVDGSCATSFSAPSADGSRTLCLTAPTEPSAAPVVRLSECDGTEQQLWVLENHWPFENVMWQRVRPASSLGSCLREQPRGNGSVSVILRSCDSDWHQQWNIRPG